MVNTLIGLTMKATETSSRRRQRSADVSTASSSSATKKSHKKKKVSHQRLPWLQEQTLPLESSSFLGCSPILDRHNVGNGRLARQQRLHLIRTIRAATSQHQNIPNEEQTLLPR
ncbi:hypothetical protein YC2023_017573 [Brassica napus]